MDRKLRVLQIGKYYPPVSGGIEIHLKSISEGLLEQVEVEVIVANTTSITSTEKINGVSVTRLKSFGKFASQPLTLTLGSELNRVAVNFNPDIVHIHTPNPLAVVCYLGSSLTKKSKLCLTWHSDILKQQNLLRFYAPYEQQILKRADAIIVSSPNMIKQSSSLPAYDQKCFIGTFGLSHKEVKSNPFEAEKIRQAYVASTNSKALIVSVGRLADYKGLDVLIQAMVGINASLLIIGEGELKKNLQSQIERLQISHKVTLLGYQENIYPFIEAADMFVLPSIDRRETFGFSQLEAMAFSKPVIATKLGSGVEYVNQHGVTGILVEPNNSAALAEAIMKLMSDPYERKRLGANGKKRFENLFTAEVALKELMAVYQRLMK